ncbi:MAG: hypothetical protein WBD13_00445 [Burkholderiaceae bacterium]
MNLPAAFHDGGSQAYESIETLIDNAVHQLDIGTYVLGNDRVGQALTGN